MKYLNKFRKILETFIDFLKIKTVLKSMHVLVRRVLDIVPMAQSKDE